MHELSIATQIVDSVTQAVLAEGDAAVAGVAALPGVAAVNVRVGVMSGVIPEALRFAWDVAAAGTRLDGAALNIEEVPLVVWCPACEAERELPGVGRLRCPVCDSPTPRVVRGRELDILSVELNDDDSPPEQSTDEPTADPGGPHADPQEERRAGT